MLGVNTGMWRALYHRRGGVTTRLISNWRGRERDRQSMRSARMTTQICAPFIFGDKWRAHALHLPSTLSSQTSHAHVHCTAQSLPGLKPDKLLSDRLRGSGCQSILTPGRLSILSCTCDTAVSGV